MWRLSDFLTPTFILNLFAWTTPKSSAKVKSRMETTFTWRSRHIWNKIIILIFKSFSFIKRYTLIKSVKQNNI